MFPSLSSGIGRTGTYIAFDYLMDEARDRAAQRPRLYHEIAKSKTIDGADLCKFMSSTKK